MVWSLALRPDDAKQDPVVYSTKFGVVFLAEGPRTASIHPYIHTYIHTYIHNTYMCVCCVFFPSILDIKFVGRTSRGHTGGRSHRIFNPPSFCGACLDFCREKDSAILFPRRPCSRILCTNELIVLHPLGIFILFF